MQNNTKFKIKQAILSNGQTVYKVYGSKGATWYNGWDEYTKDNVSFEEALEQIDHLASLIPKEVRIVYSTKYKYVNARGGEKKLEKIAK